MNYDETVFVNPDKLGLDEGDTLDELYRKLGKAYYEGAFEDPLPQLLPLFDKITKIKGLSAGSTPSKPSQNADAPYPAAVLENSLAVDAACSGNPGAMEC